MGRCLKLGNTLLRVVFNIKLRFVWTFFYMQPQPLFVFLESEAGSNNKGDKTKLSKDQTRGCIRQ